MFEYLIPYRNTSGKSNLPWGNRFDPVTDEEIAVVEGFLGYSLPSQLKLFYQEIGFGSIKVPYGSGKDYKFYNQNMIHHPLNVWTIIHEGQESGYISEDVYEDLQPGDIPFFEVGDSSWFFKMKALSDNPNAVWDTSEYEPLKIADSLEEFIYKLYYEDAQYYGDIYSARVKAREEKQK